ncbi:hypothetical protein WCX72_04635 [Sulfurimonas sp. HSL1-6]|uniref:hypothetical protein n=1 Tax=Thiomicrolovo immobilis TaxID=3131935 RepID=UPI0031F90952
MMRGLIVAIFLLTGGIAMASELTQEEQIKQLEDETKLLTKKSALVQAQKALADAEAEMDSAQLQKIKAALSEWKLPEGNKGTVTVSDGKDNTALLRSKRPMLALMDEIADTLVDLCPEGAVLVSEAELKKAYMSAYTLRMIDESIAALQSFNAQATQPSPGESMKMQGMAAAISLLGVVPEVIESVSKLFRVDRSITVFNDEAEAETILKNLLDSKAKSRFVTHPAAVGGGTQKEAEALLDKRTTMSRELGAAMINLERAKKTSEGDGAVLAMIETDIQHAKALLETLNKSEEFWNQVEGQMIASSIKEKDLLFLKTSVQTLQVKESRWYASDKLLAVGEVQVLYRLTDPDGAVKKAGVILKSSRAENLCLDRLQPAEWSRP